MMTYNTSKITLAACLIGASVAFAPAAFAQGATGAQGSPGGAGADGASGTAAPMTRGSGTMMKGNTDASGSTKPMSGTDKDMSGGANGGTRGEPAGNMSK